MVGEIEARHDGRLSLGSLGLVLGRIRESKVVLKKETRSNFEMPEWKLNFVVENEVDEL